MVAGVTEGVNHARIKNPRRLSEAADLVRFVAVDIMYRGTFSPRAKCKPAGVSTSAAWAGLDPGGSCRLPTLPILAPPRAPEIHRAGPTIFSRLTTEWFD
jgi:hypothetical protein